MCPTAALAHMLCVPMRVLAAAGRLSHTCTQPASPFVLHTLAVVSSEHEARYVPLGSHCTQRERTRARVCAPVHARVCVGACTRASVNAPCCMHTQLTYP